jgi:histidine triad (HIT) family protein
MSAGADCIFCKIVAGTIPCFKLFEDDDTLSFMDINPASVGHCLVIPKLHAPNVFAMDEQALGAAMHTAKRVATAVNTALTPDGLNLLQANGPGAAQSVHHFHIHVLPRTIGDELALNWPVAAGDMDIISAIADRICAAL